MGDVKRARAACLLLSAALLGCAAQVEPASAGAASLPEVDSARVLEDVRFLSHPALEGRAAGTPRGEQARAYIEQQFRAAGAQPLPEGWVQEFALANGGSQLSGRNVIAMIPGTEHPDRFIILTAHYDHLGRRGGQVYPGADDNASGTAALLAAARHFSAKRPRNSVALAALDAEEMGLRGARAFVDDPPIALESIALNINIDMIGRNDRGELYVAGTHHYPFLNPLVDELAGASPIRVRKGHDRPDGSAGDDWTGASDHAPFHTAGIPFLYFGVEDHPDYHRPTDIFENLQPRFFFAAVRTVILAAETADARLDEIISASAAR